MYINIIIGILVMGGLLYVVRSVYRAFRSPSAILQEEVEERRKKEQRIQENLQRVKARAVQRMVPVRKAIRDMNNSLLESQRFVVNDGEESVVLRKGAVFITVTYQLASFSVDGTVQDLSSEMAQYERFMIEARDAEHERLISREAVTHEEAIRLVAREIAAVVQH